jgi:hypothetical protein
MKPPKGEGVDAPKPSGFWGLFNQKQPPTAGRESSQPSRAHSHSEIEGVHSQRTRVHTSWPLRVFTLNGQENASCSLRVYTLNGQEKSARSLRVNTLNGQEKSSGLLRVYTLNGREDFSQPLRVNTLNGQECSLGR